MTVGDPSGANVVRAVAPGKQAQPGAMISEDMPIALAASSDKLTRRHKPPAPQVAKSHGSVEARASSAHWSTPFTKRDSRCSRDTLPSVVRPKTGSLVISSAD